MVADARYYIRALCDASGEHVYLSGPAVNYEGYKAFITANITTTVARASERQVITASRRASAASMKYLDASRHFRTPTCFKTKHNCHVQAGEATCSLKSWDTTHCGANWERS